MVKKAIGAGLWAVGSGLTNSTTILLCGPSVFVFELRRDKLLAKAKLRFSVTKTGCTALKLIL